MKTIPENILYITHKMPIVPQWILESSKLVKLMEEEKGDKVTEDDFFIEDVIRRVKKDKTVNSIEDFHLMLEIISYWDTPIFQEVKDYAKNNKELVIPELIKLREWYP